MDPQQQAQQMMHAMAGAWILIGFFWIIKIVLYTIPTWRIATRAGLSGPIALLCAVPLIGRLITLYVLAFSEWKTIPAPSAYAYPPPPPAYPPAYPPQQPPTL